MARDVKKLVHEWVVKTNPVLDEQGKYIQAVIDYYSFTPEEIELMQELEYNASFPGNVDTIFK